MCKSLCPSCSETFSLTLEANKKKYSFPSTLEADKKNVVGISIRKNDSESKDSNGKTIASAQVHSSAHITLCRSDNKNSLQQIPVDYLIYSPQAPMFTCLQQGTLNANKCELTLDPSATGFTAGQVIEITLFYDCPPQSC